MKLSIKTCSFLLTVLTIGTYIGCQPEEFTGSNGLDSPDLQATFTITPVANKNNTYLLQADPTGVMGVKWDRGDGGGYAFGRTIDTVFLPDAGKYTIGLTAIGKGGKLATSTQEVVVATSDPNSGNLVVGGKMDDPAKWTKLAIGGNSVAFDFANEKLVASGGNWGHSGVYQAIEVVGGKKYKLDLNVSGSGATDVWFEVYLGKVQPQQNQDYADGGIRLALNTWTGCGKSAFNGKLTDLACVGSLRTSKGVVQFAETGTIYLLIKSGGANLGTTGISIDNVELRGIK